ncbi:MAG: lipopolysaccharide kinase InaA family protein [Desulfobacterium sp.]
MIPLPVHTRIHRGFSIGSTVALGTTTLNLLANLLETKPEKQTRLLEGRATVRIITLGETGPVAVKTCLRGGWISRFNPHYYVRWGKTRSQRELEFLFHARNAGVQTPAPMAYITRGNALYQAWLITQAITPHITFAALSMSYPEKALDLLPEISRNITLFVDAGIFHVDLHPGNILVTPDDGIYIIDFDKAQFFDGHRKTLIQKYKNRWSRAITKYGFPNSLSALGLK